MIHPLWSQETEKPEDRNATPRRMIIRRGVLADQLGCPPRGALAVHALVPAMLRGVTATGRTKPALSRRCAAVAEAAAEQLRGQFACARPLRASDPEPEQRWLLQQLLLGPEELVASVSMVIASTGSY